jgi:hypothetical protein
MRKVMRLAAVAAGTGAVLAGTVAAPIAADAGNGIPTVTVGLNKHITVSAGSTMHAGRVVFKVTSASNPGDHELQIFKLRNGYTLTQLKKDLGPGVAGDNLVPSATERIYKGVNFLGGAMSGETFSETLYAGTYYLIDIGGAQAQEFKTLHVTGTPPQRGWLGDGSVITMHDMSFSANHAIPGSGWTVLRNTGDEPHFLSWIRVKASTTRADVKKALSSNDQPSWMLGPDQEVAIVSPGSQIVFKHNLPVGKYLALCWMPDPDAKDMPHAMMGMYQFLTVK